MSGDLRELRGDPFGLLAELDRRLRAVRQEGASGEAEWEGLGVRVGSLWCVLPRADVREVITPPPLTRVPGARPWLIGLANVRGNLLPVFDLAVLAGLPAEEDTRSARVLVLNSDQLPAGFMVGEVVGHRQFAVEDQAPHRLQILGGSDFSNWLLGAFERDAQVWQVLSLHRLVASEQFVRTAE